MDTKSTLNAKSEHRILHYAMAAFFVFAGIAIDQLTKHLAVVYLKDQEPFVILKDIFELHYLENRGAAFGIFQNQQLFFLLSVLVISGASLWFYGRVPMERHFLPLRSCAVLILAGGLGNCIDRVSQSYVVDFLYFKLIDFPIFNVADIYVTVATFLVVFLLFFYYKEEEIERIFHR